MDVDADRDVGPDRVADRADDGGAARASSPSESTGSVASSGATFIAENPAATIARAESAYSSGVVPRGPLA